MKRQTGKTASANIEVNRPPTNRNIKLWLRTACEVAAEAQAWINLACDTAEQVEINARRVAKLLLKYRRVALERASAAISHKPPERDRAGDPRRSIAMPTTQPAYRSQGRAPERRSGMRPAYSSRPSYAVVRTGPRT
jgi:hypothetical protein